MVASTKKTILCIDDDQEMLELFRLILSRRGFDVIGARGGKQALELLKSKYPDVILLDLMMPEMDGWEVFQRIKTNPTIQHIPVIFVTAKAESVDKVMGLHIANAADYIPKPFSPQELYERIEKVLQSPPTHINPLSDP